MHLDGHISSKKLLDDRNKAFITFFKKIDTDKHMICVFLDLEPTMIDEIRIGTYQFFHLK